MQPNPITTRQPGSPSAPPAAGTVLAGRYEVVRPHHGGTLLGRDTVSLASVVISIAEADLVPSAAAELIAGHVTRLRGLLHLAAPVFAGRDGDWFVLVAPLAHGVTLAERLTRGGLSPDSALRVARDLLGALDGSHRCGLLHLGISPATVIVNPDGPVREATLIGFGAAALRHYVAAALRDRAAGESGPADVRYAAPEQAGALDRPIDHRADLYALGLVLHECLTGRPPYQANTDGELLRRRLTDRPPPLRADRPEIPAELEAEILGMLAVEPSHRPADAAAVLHALAAALDPLAAVTESAGPPVARPPAAGVGPGAAAAGWPPEHPGALIGREAELAELAAHIRAAERGRTSAVLVEGAAGIGKTRLLDELCREAAAQGAAVLRGGAVEHPRAPAGGLDGVVGGLIELAAADAACRERLRVAVQDDDAARSLCTLLPRLGPLLRPAPARAHQRRSADPERWSGATALAQLLAAVGRPGCPVVVVLDDCQWADLAVFELIGAWAAAAAERGLDHAVLIAAFRPRGLAPDHPLRDVAAIGRIALDRLDDATVAELARRAGITPANPGPATAAFVVAAAAGNPAAAELAVNCLCDGGGAWPELAPTAEDLAAWRLEMLPEDLRKMLGAGAVLGREFSLDAAAAMLGRGDTWTELAAATAERRLLVARTGPDTRRLAFCHDGLRQAVLAAIPPAERRRLNARACDVLGQAPGGAVYAAAWHAVASADSARAVPRALAAARAATARQAPDIAELYLREARRHAPDVAPDLALEIVEDLAAAHLAQGRGDLAEEQLEAAARLAHEPADQAAISTSLARLGASRGDHSTATAAAEAAIRARGGRIPRPAPVLALVVVLQCLARLCRGRVRRPAGGPVREARAQAAAEYALLGRSYAGGGRRLAAAWAGLRALRHAESAGRGPQLVECQGAQARLLADAGLRRRSLAAARRATAAATELGHDGLTAACLAGEGELLYAAGRLEPAAERFARAAARLTDGDRVDGRAAGLDAVVLWGGLCALRLGRAAPARDAAATVRRCALAADAPGLAAQALSLGLKAAGSAGGPARIAPAPAPDSAAAFEARGLELLGAGELDAAIEALERAAASAESDTAQEREASAAARVWLATARRRSAEEATGPEARELIRRAAAAARAATRAAARRRSNLPHARREQGLIDAVAGRTRRARRRLRQSVRAAERQSAAAELAHSLAAIGRVGLGAGWPDAAASLAAARRAVSALEDGAGDDGPGAHLLGSPMTPSELAAAGRSSRVVPALTDPAAARPAPAPTGSTTGSGVAVADTANPEPAPPPAGRSAARPDDPASIDARRDRPPSLDAVRDGPPSIDERLATLLAGGRGISSAPSREAIFDAVREVSVPLLGGERAVIVHLAGASGPPLVSGYSPECGESLARVCRALAVAAASGGHAVAISAGEAGEVGLDTGAVLRGGVGAAICAPISRGDRVTSCVYVDRSELADPFGADELRLAEFVAGMAGTALENAEGFAKVESLSRSLEERVEERTAQLADSNRQLDLSLQRLTEAFERERESAAELKHQAFHDPLTDLANRALFVDRVGHALEVARRAGHEVAVLFVDLDDFKTVNDSLGHPAGDELLVAVAARLREVLRRADTAARLGGDEFGVLLEGVDRDGAVRTAARIIEALDIPFKLAAKEVFVHASIGIALRTTREITVDALLRNADVAMYIVKSAGKHGFEVFEQRMHDAIVRRLELKDDLHRGIELRQFVVHYQPIVDIATSRIHGLEALIRWNHPEHGMISPLDFVPLAEESGMIRALGDWVLRTACEATRGWQLEAGHEGERLTIGVNLSARELHEPGLVDCVAAALGGSGLAPQDLTLEITESVLMNDTEAAIERLQELKALGVRLAIDDFGTGYSSLSYLKHLPVDIVKIAKPFVDDIADGPQEAALAGAIVALSETLRLQTVAEGIEQPDQLRALERLGCDFGQGYLFARPAPAAETGALLRGDRRFPVGGPPNLRLLRAV